MELSVQKKMWQILETSLLLAKKILKRNIMIIGVINDDFDPENDDYHCAGRPESATIIMATSMSFLTSPPREVSTRRLKANRVQCISWRRAIMTLSAYRIFSGRFPDHPGLYLWTLSPHGFDILSITTTSPISYRCEGQCVNINVTQITLPVLLAIILRIAIGKSETKRRDGVVRERMGACSILGRKRVSILQR
ncbi:hypothetical protein WG66_010496 [Moniliophthora roreri]|nr:hypothetical protein WG66_010496 [Moniliophthora roreri]